VVISTAETIAAIFRGSNDLEVALEITALTFCSGINLLTSKISIFPKRTISAKMVNTVIIPTASNINAVLNSSFMIPSFKWRRKCIKILGLYCLLKLIIKAWFSKKMVFENWILFKLIYFDKTIIFAAYLYVRITKKLNF